MDASVTGAQAVERALAILGLFDERTTEISIAEAAVALSVHRSTAARLFGALERRRLVEPTPGGYRLGLGLVSLAGLVLNRYPVRALAHEALRELRDATGESAYLGLLDGREVVYIDQVSSPHVSVNIDWVGYRQRLGEGATGRVLLAFQPDEVIAEVLADAAAAEDLEVPDRAQLAAIRARGHLMRLAEGPAGGAVAAPVRDHRGDVVAAVSLWGPRRRIDLERLETELLPAVLHAAEVASESLGHLRA